MAAGNTYTPIATANGSGTNLISFTSIPSTYTDIIAVMTLQGSGYCDLRINNDSGGNYSFTQFYGSGTTAGSARVSNQDRIEWEGMPENPNIGNAVFNFSNYANTTSNKSFLFESHAPNGVTRLMAGLWRSNSAINRLDFLFVNAGSWSTGTTITLYGIAAA
jgi:hypothetical protein